MVDPVKDGEQERSIPDVWRPTLAAIVDSIARGEEGSSTNAADRSQDFIW